MVKKSRTPASKSTTKKKNQLPPDSYYILHAYLYSQEKVAEALGIPKGIIRRIYCDGDNKVRVEVYTDK